MFFAFSQWNSKNFNIEELWETNTYSCFANIIRLEKGNGLQIILELSHLTGVMYHEGWCVSFHSPLSCLLKSRSMLTIKNVFKSLPRLIIKKPSKFCIDWTLCKEAMIGFLAQRASKAEKVSISWRQHVARLHISRNYKELIVTDIWLFIISAS